MSYFEYYKEDELQFLLSILNKSLQNYKKKIDIIEDVIDDIETSIKARKV